MVCLRINWVIYKGIRRPKGDVAVAGAAFYGHISKIGLLPVIQG